MEKDLNIFGIKIYHGQVSDRERIEEALSQINPLDHTKRVSQIDSKNSDWKCDVNTGHNEDLCGEWSDVFLSVVENNILEYVRSIKVRGSFECGIHPPWINVYELNDYQEVHCHTGDNALSYCYFHRVPKGSGEFIFYNAIGKNNTFGQPSNPFVQTVEPYFIPQVKEGDLIVFPSWLDHMVSHNRSCEHRITLSGNIYIKEALSES